MSAQSSKPNIAIVQDALVGSFLMSKGTDKLSKGEFFDITMKAYKNTTKGDEYGVYSLERINEIKKVLKMKGKKTKIYNGRGLISLILPSDLIYNKKNEANPDEPVVRIYRGVLYEGTLDKTILGSSHNSLIQIIHKEYGSKRAVEFIDNIQFLANNWLLVYGFSVGLEDCMIASTNSTIEIKDEISKCYIEAKGVEQTTKNPGIREVRINAALNKAKDIGMRIAKEAMTKNNNLLATVGSGSKGDFFNIAQLTGLLGQQNLKGKRVPRQLNHGKRTLPHYSFGDLDVKEEYESRGFIRHSFIHGLNPQEFFFHAMSGREGICDKHAVSQTVGCFIGCFVTNKDKQCKTKPTIFLVVYNLLVITRWQNFL
jgi:DNA-directed RNA polymerase II subunit RPB1